MKLESAVKYFSPKSQTFTDSSRATASDSLTGSDLMGAIGMCQSKSPFGIAGYMAKTGVSNEDRYRAIEQLLSYANRTAPELVIRAAGGKLGKCLVVLSKLAFEEYYRSAATTSTCQHCNGKGEITARCRCNGTGRVRDLAESARQGAPIERECERCSGRGFRRMPSSRAFQAVTLLLPDLTQSSWSRNWKPFFETLVAKCEIEESHADAEFRKVTK